MTKIAVFAGSYDAFKVPEAKQIAPHAIAIDMAEGLQELGCQVDFYGPKGTSPLRVNQIIDLDIQPIYQGQLEKDIQKLPPDRIQRVQTETWIMQDILFLHQIYEKAARGEYDVVVQHGLERGLSVANMFPQVKTLYILHDPYRDWKQFLNNYNHPNLFYVPISHFQQRKYQTYLPSLNYTEVCYNGIDTDQFQFNSKPEHDLLVFAGRITVEKGPHLAVQTALRTNRKLILAGSIQGEKNQNYFDQEIKPYLNQKIKYLGEASRSDVVNIMSRAEVLLAPIQNDEPFGLTLAEAQACGTPVITFPRGAAPEIVQDGISGFIVSSLDEMVESVRRIKNIDRKVCRQNIMDRFDLKSMNRGYLQAIELISQPINKS
ncbi:MAG: hypothetical protein OHK0017_02690 [Patescibacteria group bacterium]